VEKVLAAFDLEQVDQIAGADAALHEHRTVLEAPDNRPDLLTAEEAVEELRDLWGLALNIDGERNLDDKGEELGLTGWRCLVRVKVEKGQFKYIEVLLTADCLSDAQDMAAEAAEETLGQLNRAESQETEEDPASAPREAPPDNYDIVAADRVRQEDFVKLVQ